MKLIKWQKNKQNKKSGQLGFTLIEIVVATAVFSTAAVLITDIFMMSQKAQLKTAGQTKIQADARYVIEAMSREIRMSSIDYDYLTNELGVLSDPLETDFLPLLDIQGNSTVFSIKDAASLVCHTGVTNCLAVKRNDSAWASITPDDVNVTDVSFYIYPSADPFEIIIDPVTPGDSGYRVNTVPYVTVVFESESEISKDGVSEINNLQTTVSSRVYKR